MSLDRNALKGVYDFRDDGFANRLEIGLKTWLDWGLLKVGGWQNIAIPNEDMRGEDFSLLRPVDRDGVAAGTVWEGRRKDWVWEADIDFNDGTTLQNPVTPVIKVNGSTVAPSYIDYPNGQVIFSAAQSVSAVVQAEHSYRLVQVYRENDVPWLRRLQYDSTDSANSYFSQSTGELTVDSNKRVQMPAVVLGIVARSEKEGYQLGDGAFWNAQDVICRIYAMSKAERNHIVSILDSQFDNTMWLFDNNAAAEDGNLPLDYRGALVDNTKTYEYLVDAANGYRWKQCKFIRSDVASVESLSPYLFEGSVRWSCQVVLDD